MKRLRSIICAALCALVCAGCAAPEGETMERKLMPYAIEAAQYPDYPRFVDPGDYYRADGSWDGEAYGRAAEAAERVLAEMGKTGAAVDSRALLTFADETAGQVLLARGGENGVYSPVSLYTAMAMLAELCDGGSREELLAALNTADMETMRETVHQLWLQIYCDSGAATCRMANSLWLNEQLTFYSQPLEVLARDYYASSYRVAMGTGEADRAIGQWISGQTGGMLAAETDNIRTEALTLVQLYSTLYFKARWQDLFDPEQTEEGLFHLYDADGTAVAWEFMHRESAGAYRQGEGYTAAMLPFAAGGGYMTFCLPDSDTNVDELLRRDTLVSELREMTEHGSIVRWTVPRFDVSSSVGLNGLLREMGVTEVFDAQTADLSMLTDVAAHLDSVRQAARVKIDEEGVEAAAFTEMAVCASALPVGIMEMTLDRPFLFAIYSADGLPLFVGAVQRPE